jgi:RNA polymerase sigma-70 factor (ECF subfamily)
MRNDLELVANALAGEPSDFAPIVDRYQDAVFGIALARVGNFHDAQDIAQSVFLDAYTGLAHLQDPMRFGGWLRTFAINKSIDKLRTRKDTVDIDRIIESKELAAHLDATSGGDLRDAVLAAIGKLSGPQRETVALFYINGYTVDEVADMQGTPAGTVKSRLHDARKKL